MKQMEKIVEAIALTLPNGGVNQSGLSNIGTQSTSNLAIQAEGGNQGQERNFRYEMIKELANDMGFEPKLFVRQL